MWREERGWLSSLFIQANEKSLFFQTSQAQIWPAQFNTTQHHLTQLYQEVT